MLATFFLNSGRLSLHSLAASTLAGDSSLGEDSMLITDSTMLSTCRGGEVGAVHVGGWVGQRVGGWSRV